MGEDEVAMWACRSDVVRVSDALTFTPERAKAKRAVEMESFMVDGI